MTEPASSGTEASCNPIDKLRQLCKNNADYFARDSSENGQRLYLSCLAILDTLDVLIVKVQYVEERAGAFDFDEKTPANGYRSFIKVFNSAVQYAIDLNEKVLSKRGSVLFRKTVLTKEIETGSHLLASLDTFFTHLQTILSWGKDDGNLFVEGRPLEELIAVCKDVNQYCFYGRSLGFQFCDSLKYILQFIALFMAIFSDAYYQDSMISFATTSIMSTTKYFASPEQRAKRIVDVSQNADVSFCKAFWFLLENELLVQLPMVVSPAVSVCKMISIAPEPFTLTVNGKELEIPIPMAHLGPKPVQVRLISYIERQGMLGTKNKDSLEPACDGLLIHCHGGGFVAQSSKSHESYLRDWAKGLNVPILCIDYSLTPEAPFPRAHQEVFYAYCWALKHHAFLGSKGKRIIVAGDSAGANLWLSTTLRCLHDGIPPPHGILAAYVPTLVKFTPSPARLLCMMDPVLPFGFLMRCLIAYASPPPKPQPDDNNHDLFNSERESFVEISESDLVDLQAHKSPGSEASDTLTDGSFNSKLDELPEKDDTSAAVEKSQNHMADIVQKYVLGRDYLGSVFSSKYNTATNKKESDTDTEDVQTSQLNAESTSSSVDTSLQNRLFGFVTSIKDNIGKMLGERKFQGPPKVLEMNKPSTLWDELRVPLQNDVYMSPYCASNDDLQNFPTTKIIGVHLDSCLDDCVMFAKRLKSLNRDVTLDVLDGLPHGFLNFSLFSKDAYEGSKLCVKRMKEMLTMDKDQLQSENNTQKK